jgi:hypothetical protein
MSCVEVKKLPEGNFNKVFLLTMNDGKEFIAKLPNPNAGSRYFTTASEVATMDYVRVACLHVAKLYDLIPVFRFGMYSIFQPPWCTLGAPLPKRLEPSIL